MSGESGLSSPVRTRWRCESKARAAIGAQDAITTLDASCGRLAVSSSMSSSPTRNSIRRPPCLCSRIPIAQALLVFSLNSLILAPMLEPLAGRDDCRTGCLQSSRLNYRRLGSHIILHFMLTVRPTPGSHAASEASLYTSDSQLPAICRIIPNVCAGKAQTQGRIRICVPRPRGWAAICGQCYVNVPPSTGRSCRGLNLIPHSMVAR
ncbi:hypothetical protein C8Q77DRAFT_515615 [Trametes polyzona]|nr:hypothetical protein C8Q77DRAFT_515615 [Trametes polyzona]